MTPSTRMRTRSRPRLRREVDVGRPDVERGRVDLLTKTTAGVLWWRSRTVAASSLRAVRYDLLDGATFVDAS